MLTVAVVSPHLDDGVFSCGVLIEATALIADVAVVTVFGGDETRAREDAAACAVLGARHVHLGLVEGAGIVTVSEALQHALTASIVVAPIGIRHPDHKTVAAACDGLAHVRYEELPYRVLWPEQAPYVLGVPDAELSTTARKMQAVRCYASQLNGPPGEALWASERYHRAAT